MDRMFAGITFKRYGYSPEDIERMNQPNYGKKPDKRTVKQLIAAYNQPLPTPEEIELFETALNILLPDDYKQFLLKVNGGKPSKKLLSGFGTGINTFLALNSPYAYNGIEPVYLLSDPKDCWGTQKVIPIGTSSGGDYFLMRVAANESHAIYFYEHDGYYEDEYFDIQQAPHLANSFMELLSALLTEEEWEKTFLPHNS